ncbi:two component transcriptional regulator, LuxR family [Nocardioides terrae]|uniref:Two component transcriptional regulator, LuxR family n=1 Tax=Nocardioides terrae TaxID=574651 RepID=A0A1I1H5D2_9ACTN|nr:response regulator transcription factor [Nocardioides terrae]SFC19154.1 two component transcriptional regulator, LuxR family [Nocardioides terrae]
MLDQPLRLAIVSRQEVVARGLTAMLADYPDRVTVVALASAYARAKGVDVVLYDTLGLHRSDASDLDHLIQKTDAKVVIYSRDMRPDLRARALARGVDGWVSMSLHAGELVEAVERIADGKPTEDQVDWIGHEAGLSPREVEVLSLITQGLSNQDIADRLFLTINTLKSHIRQSYKKIGVSSRAQAVAWCMQHGFAPPDA